MAAVDGCNPATPGMLKHHQTPRTTEMSYQPQLVSQILAINNIIAKGDDSPSTYFKTYILASLFIQLQVSWNVSTGVGVVKLAKILVLRKKAWH